MIHIYSGILVIKKNEIMTFAATWIDPKEVNYIRERQMSFDTTYMWNLGKEYK